MNKFQIGRMKGHPRDSPLCHLFRTILSVSNHRMPDGRKLHPNLVLQSRHQRDAHQSRTAKSLLYAVPEFCPGGFLVALFA